MNWKDRAILAVESAAYDPDPEAVAVYQIPNRRWWQFWRPKWQTVRGISRAEIVRSLSLNPHD